jgi:hypothetical protein
MFRVRNNATESPPTVQEKPAGTAKQICKFCRIALVTSLLPVVARDGSGRG